MGDRSYIKLAILMILCDLTVGQNFCAKIDFNRTFYPEFHQCQRNQNQLFMSFDYALHANIRPYRPNSHYYLSNGFTGYSCAEYNNTMTFNKNTIIEAAIFLKTIDKSFVDILIYDADQDKLIDSFRRTNIMGWLIVRGTIKQNVQRARVRRLNMVGAKFHITTNILFNSQVEILAFITDQNELAIEYLNILNSAIKTPECMNQLPPTIPTNIPPGGTNSHPDQMWWWIVISICLGILLIIILFVGIYCLIDNRRNRSHDCTNK